MPSTRQTLTALSQSSRQTVASLLLSQRGPELEGAEPAGQSGAGARHTRSGNCAVAPGGSSGQPLMSDVDRGCWTEWPGQEGALEFVQVSGFALGPGWAGALEPLRGPPSPGKALLNWTPESLCTLTPTPHLGGLGPPHPVPAPASQELARLQVGEGVWGHSRARGQWAAWVGEVSPVLHGRWFRWG